MDEFRTILQDFTHAYFYMPDDAEVAGCPAVHQRPIPYTFHVCEGPFEERPYQSMIITGEDLSLPLNPNHWFHVIASELIRNYYQMGATILEICRTQDRTYPRDMGFEAPWWYCYTDFQWFRFCSNLLFPNDDIPGILDNINSDRPVSTRIGGGVGIVSSREILAQHAEFSSLRYYRGKIVDQYGCELLYPDFPWSQYSGIETVVIFGGETVRYPWPEEGKE